MDEKVHCELVNCEGLAHPSSAQDLKSFLGLASYYRGFMRGISCIAAPLQKERRSCEQASALQLSVCVR